MGRSSRWSAGPHLLIVTLGCGDATATAGETDAHTSEATEAAASSTQTSDAWATTSNDESSETTTTGSDVGSCRVDVVESADDAVCPPLRTTAERIEACLCDRMPALLEPAPRPLDATDLLYYVNRWYSIDPCFPYPPDDALLAEVRANYINQVDDLEPELETQCGAYEDDLVDIPFGLTDDDDRIRQIAWQSPAPEDHLTTLDDLPVGFEGAVGFGPMFQAAAEEMGISLYVRSGFRDLATQAWLFDAYADVDGPAQASVYSAWPAHSEHQLGTTADVGYIEDGVFINPFDPLEADLHWTEAFVWIRANAHRFGIVTTYQPRRVHVHQYKPEPWHLRFVGVPAADLMHACALSTEELLAFRYDAGPLPAFAEMDLVYDAQVSGGWTPATCAD